MPKYVAMLRGINVSGHKLIRMEPLRAACVALGFGEVKTYVQSGNLVFAAPAGAAATLTRAIGQMILRDFGFSVPVILRTVPDLEKIVRENPFLKTPAMDAAKLHVTFLSALPPSAAREALLPLAVPPEQFHLHGREIYLHCPHGYGGTKLSNAAIEKRLNVEATTRNWKTVNALLALAG